jgi:hypothetical protein
MSLTLPLPVSPPPNAAPQYEPSKQAVIILIEASPTMLEMAPSGAGGAAIDGEEGGPSQQQPRSFLGVAIDAVVQIMRWRILHSPNDEIGVMLYGAVRGGKGRRRPSRTRDTARQQLVIHARRKCRRSTTHPVTHAPCRGATPQSRPTHPRARPTSTSRSTASTSWCPSTSPTLPPSTGCRSSQVRLAVGCRDCNTH